MQNIDLNTTIKRFGAHSLWVGILLLMLGTLGIVLPVAMSEMTIMLIASLMAASGILWAWHSFRHGANLMDWIKPFGLLLACGLLALRPRAGLDGIALLIAGYLVFDAFASFSLFRAAAGHAGRNWMIVNAVANLLLAGIFMWGWPQTSPWMVGLFVGVSLVFDGWALVMIGWAMRHQ
jgi:uncharacterized membrane protein HdeD (DUF308 family)